MTSSAKYLQWALALFSHEFTIGCNPFYVFGEYLDLFSWGKIEFRDFMVRMLKMVRIEWSKNYVYVCLCILEWPLDLTTWKTGICHEILTNLKQSWIFFFFGKPRKSLKQFIWFLSRQKTLKINYASGGQNLERWHVERSIFRNFKISSIKITEDGLFEVLFFKLIFYILEIIWTLKIFNDFSSYEIFIFQMAELICFYFSYC